MGHFSNGTEGALYEERYCTKCAHYGPDGLGCPILTLHSAYNGIGIGPNATQDEKRVSIILDELIPRGIHGNEKCRMHTPEAQFPLIEDDDVE